MHYDRPKNVLTLWETWEMVDTVPDVAFFAPVVNRLVAFVKASSTVGAGNVVDPSRQNQWMS